MKLLIYLLLIIFPLGQLVRWDLGKSIILHPNDLVVLLVLIFGLRKISGPLVKPLLLFLVAIILSLTLNVTNFEPYELLTASLYGVRFYLYALLYFVFRQYNIPHRWLLISILTIALSGLLQYFLRPDVSFLKAANWDDHYYRLIGTFLDPGFTGAILVLGLLLSLRGVLTTKQSDVISRLLRSSESLAITLIIYVAMALTYSRASYLMYLISFAAVSVSQRSLKIFMGAVVILLLTIQILPRPFGEGVNLSRENSIRARINNWKQSLSIWQKSPVFGIGFNTYRYVSGASPESHAGSADSSVLLVLATTGILGLTAYCYLLAAMWRLGRHNLLFQASFLGILAHSFFNNTLFYPAAMEWLWLLLAIAQNRTESKIPRERTSL